MVRKMIFVGRIDKKLHELGRPFNTISVLLESIRVLEPLENRWVTDVIRFFF